MNDNILIAGLPRSGTTWLAQVLGRSRAHDVVIEPDNEKTSWLAWYGKRRLPRFPTLEPGAHQPAYAALWRYAFAGRLGGSLSRGALTRPLRLIKSPIERGIVARELAAARRAVAWQGDSEGAYAGVGDPPRARQSSSARPRIVKSVHSPLCVAWVAEQTAAPRVALVFRNPLSIIASMQRLAMNDAFRPGSLAPHLTAQQQEFICSLNPAPHPPYDIRLVALQVFAMSRHFERVAAAHPSWTVVKYEDLCRAPVEGFERLFERLGCEWTHRVAAAIEAANRSGQGYQTRRIASQQIDSWRRELSTAQVDAIEWVRAEFFSDGDDPTLAERPSRTQLAHQA